VVDLLQQQLDPDYTMTRILVLGPNTPDTDRAALHRSQALDLPFHGLIAGDFPDGVAHGVYHTSVYDTNPLTIVAAAAEFDTIEMVDLPGEQWPTQAGYTATVDTIQKCQLSNPTVFKGVLPDTQTPVKEIFSQNKSICVHPFITFTQFSGARTLCCQSVTPVDTAAGAAIADNLTRKEIKELMLQGKSVNPHCVYCYQEEKNSVISPRIAESVTWIDRLNIRTVEQLVRHPVVNYEIRPSSRCNLQCRMCGPYDSDLIQQEWQELGWLSQALSPKNNTSFDQVDLALAQRVFVAGGEPTAMPEFHEFLDRIIQAQRQDLQVVCNTNAVKFSDRFRHRVLALPNFEFVISIDAWGAAADYIRWPGPWRQVQDNTGWAWSTGRKLTFNITLSVYNAMTVGATVESILAQWPDRAINIQRASSLRDRLNPAILPRRPELLASLDLAAARLSGTASATVLVAVREQLTAQGDPERIRDFLEFNRALDRHRGVELAASLPDLAGLLRDY
jgi:sulfatase maturation enzyme AslB (radical SAM superfamily)